MNTRLISLIPVFSALTAAGSFIRIPIPPVPITMQSFFVLLSGMLLGPRAGALSQIVYFLLGLIGLPVFSGGGGLSYVAKPSFGYILGFIAASAISGHIVQRKGYTLTNILFASLCSMSAIYLIGTPYLAFNLHYIVHKPDALGFALKAGLIVFLPGDILKCILLAVIVPRLRNTGIIGHRST